MTVAPLRCSRSGRLCMRGPSPPPPRKRLQAVQPQVEVVAARQENPIKRPEDGTQIARRSVSRNQDSHATGVSKAALQVVGEELITPPTLVKGRLQHLHRKADERPPIPEFVPHACLY